MLKSSQELNIIAAKVQSPQEGQVGEASDLVQWVFSKVELFEVNSFDILDFANFVLVKW